MELNISVDSEMLRERDLNKQRTINLILNNFCNQKERKKKLPRIGATIQTSPAS